jgi:hypothetical protein
VGNRQIWAEGNPLEAEEVEEAKEVEEESSREIHRERKALRAAVYVGGEEPVWQLANSPLSG